MVICQNLRSVFFLGLIAGLADLISSVNTNFALLSDIIVSIIVAFIAVHICNFAELCYQGVVLSGVVWALPGISISISMQELAAGNPVSGVVRLFSALFTSIKLAFGIAIGTKLAFWLSPPSQLNCNRELSRYLDFIWVPLVTIGFIILLGSHIRQWPGMFLTSIVSYLASLVVQQLGPSANELVPIVASFFTVLVANLIGRFTHTPSFPYVIGGIMPLLPGSLSLKAALIAESDVSIGLGFSIEMIVTALQLTIGIFVATLVVFPHRGFLRL